MGIISTVGSTIALVLGIVCVSCPVGFFAGIHFKWRISKRRLEKIILWPGVLSGICAYILFALTIQDHPEQYLDAFQVSGAGLVISAPVCAFLFGVWLCPYQPR